MKVFLYFVFSCDQHSHSVLRAFADPESLMEAKTSTDARQFDLFTSWPRNAIKLVSSSESPCHWEIDGIEWHRRCWECLQKRI